MAMRCQPRLSDQNVGNTRSHGSLATIAGRMICRPVSLGRLFFCITALINELPGDSVALNRALSDAHRSRIRTLRVPSVPKVRRNDLVGPCDSGKKYKRCCGGATV